MDTPLDIATQNVKSFFERNKAALIGGAIGGTVLLGALITLAVCKLRRRGRGVYQEVKDASMTGFELPRHK